MPLGSSDKSSNNGISDPIRKNNIKPKIATMPMAVPKASNIMYYPLFFLFVMTLSYDTFLYTDNTTS